MTSSLGYPFGPPGSEAPSAPRSLVALTSSALGVALGAASLPWRLALGWLAWASGLMLRVLSSLGAPPPAGFLPAVRAAQQLRELNSIVDHMHSREDLYRRAIRELQEDLDAKDSDRRKALRKLRTTRDEINALGERLAEAQAAYGASAAAVGDDGGGSGALPGRGLGVHATVVAATAAVWAFSQSDHAALHWKLVFTMFFPLLWVYVSWLAAAAGGGGGGSARPPLLLLGGAWFLVGFATALTLGGGPAGPL